MRRTKNGARVRIARARRGVTLVEMLVAMTLITFAAIGILTVSGSVAGGMGNGMRHTIAAGVAQARLDSLTSLACASLEGGAGSGAATTRGVEESWTVVDGRNIKTIYVTVKIPRRQNPLKYETVVPCRDL